MELVHRLLLESVVNYHHMMGCFRRRNTFKFIEFYTTLLSSASNFLELTGVNRTLFQDLKIL